MIQLWPPGCLAQVDGHPHCGQSEHGLGPKRGLTVGAGGRPADPGGAGSYGHEALAVPAPVCAPELLPASGPTRTGHWVQSPRSLDAQGTLSWQNPSLQHLLQHLRHRYRLTLSSHFCAQLSLHTCTQT